MEQYVFTPLEEEVLSSIHNDDHVSIYEITTATRLSPSEALEVLDHLRERNLVRLMENNRQAQLTGEGRHVRELIERQKNQPFSGSGPAQVVVTSIENETGASRKAFEELPPEELDLALDSEIQKLEQEAGAG
jgi:cation transport regulator ChaC